MWRRLLASMCVVASLLFFGCGPVPSPPNQNCRPTVYAFSAPWCSACQQDKPILTKLEQAGYKVVRVNIDVHPDWQRKHHITSIPLYLVICRGSVVLRTPDIDVVVRRVNRGCAF